MAVAGVNVVVRTVTLGRTSGGFGMQISSLRHCLGVFVSGLTGRGPAASAGMQDGDVILAINGRSVVNAPFEDVLARLKAEDTLHLKLLQKRSSLSEQACVSDTAEDPHARMTVDLIALAAGPNGFGMKISTDENRFGIFIDAVQPGSPASEAGLSSGTIILEVNGVCVVDETVENVIAALRQQTPARLLILEAPSYEGMDDGVGGMDAIALHDITLNDSAV